MSKYDPLYNYLNSKKEEELVLSFSEIEKILGFNMPESAYKHQAWWSNSIKCGQHSYAKSWLEAGYETRDVSVTQPERKIIFYRVNDK